ncbi:hypothetical protein BaRGS_00033907 [Batillaria attramentaria]|uniref:Uncharacterized protein n=1 Tax=Batillaria attramentaria TaxID=370345 RepID=A0ABD0JJL0_9CAEN
MAKVDSDSHLAAIHLALAFSDNDKPSTIISDEKAYAVFTCLLCEPPFRSRALLIDYFSLLVSVIDGKAAALTTPSFPPAFLPPPHTHSTGSSKHFHQFTSASFEFIMHTIPFTFRAISASIAEEMAVKLSASFVSSRTERSPRLTLAEGREVEGWKGLTGDK